MIPSVPTHFSVARSVCLSSVVCHIRAPCLNSSTDVDAIWRVHSWVPVTRCVRWGSLTLEEEEICGRTPGPGFDPVVCYVACVKKARNDVALRALDENQA